MGILHKKQVIFSVNFARLVTYVNNQPGYEAVIGEVARDPRIAKLNAEAGIGSRRSLHIDRLAGDLLIFKDDDYLTQTEDYEFAGTYWKSLHPDNRWGGDFRNKDGNHFSMGYEGRA